MAEIVLTYAKALFDAAAEADRKEPCLKDALSVLNVIRENPDFERILRSPEITADEKTRLIVRVFGADISEPFMGFLHVLVRKGRIENLEQIVREFEAMVEESENRVTAQVSSAAELSEAEKEKLIRTLEKSTGKTVRLHTMVDPSLIGGLVVRVKDKIYDNSIRSSLAKMSRHLKDVRISEDKVV